MHENKKNRKHNGSMVVVQDGKGKGSVKSRRTVVVWQPVRFTKGANVVALKESSVADSALFLYNVDPFRVLRVSLFHSQSANSFWAPSAPPMAMAEPSGYQDVPTEHLWL